MARKLKPDELYRRCDPGLFEFETTEELEPLEEIIGQERAVKALELGLGIRDRRYNIYVAGDAGTGKNSTVRAFLERVSAKEPQPPDLCYVHNFQDPYCPRYLSLPTGEGSALKSDMKRLVDHLKREIPTAFKSKEYQERRRKIDEAIVARRDRLFEKLEEPVAQGGFVLQRTPIGINAIPVRGGKPLTEEGFLALSEEERRQIEENREKLQTLIQETLRQVATLEEERAQQVERLNREVAHFIIHPKVAQLKEKYAEQPRVVAFLEEAEADMLKNVHDFLGEGQPQEEDRPAAPFGGEVQDPFLKYDVNVIVDNRHTRGAPVVVQDNATYPNLFGSVERRVQMGVMTADFTMIRPGSLHEANGGYLVLSADNLFRNGLSWEGLKVALKCGKIRIEDPAHILGYATAEGLRPEPIPFDVKIIILGSQDLYQVLNAYEEDFRKFFNVKSDFDAQMPWEPKYLKPFGPFIRARCLERGLLPFHKSGVARVVEYAAELTGDQEKLSARFSDIMVIVREADYWARRDHAEAVRAEHVQRAIEEKVYRSNLVEEKIQEMIERGEILVDTSGAVVGQVNGLSLYELGDFTFGRPTRITANVYTGKEGVVNIEREAELSGKIHTKGLLILKGWLGEKFAYDKPLSLTASLTFEQSYGPVDGDSASSTELYALISALSGVPIRQGIAVTGSVNQKGQIQPIGGVNEKVEGFYKVCKAKGLTGEQGVIIPRQNVKNLMLQREVVEAVEAGRFHLWAVETVEEGLEVLTGQAAGRFLDRDGRFEEGSLYAKADERLRQMAKHLEGAKGKAEEEEED